VSEPRPLASIFGVRHFSPAAALHVRRHLEEHRPDVVLIEGPSDATDQLVHLAHKKTRPPVALLAFTKTRPVRSILYPMAAYSPEWVALRWALEHDVPVRFMDLPASVFLELHELEAKAQAEAEGADAGEADADGANAEASAQEVEAPEDHTHAYLDDPHEAIARLCGEADHDTWWERHFEHTREASAYREAIFEFGKGLREHRRNAPAREKETLLREAFMRREILAARAGDPPKGKARGKAQGSPSATKVVVVCGAYHSPALTDALPPMTDDELAALPRADAVLTLMPYSYPRLSSQSGYGAGNHAPSYFEALHEESLAGMPERLRARYLTEVARRLRRDGIVRSSAEVIEAVRLAEGLAAMNGSPAPALRDLRDAAITLLGGGERHVLEKALREVEIGTAVGALPPGVSRTALQDDFHQLVKTLKLEKYLEDKDQSLELDLRENRQAKTTAAAFLDRARSTFLHRLAVLDVGFARAKAREQRGTAKESWKLRWTPECEIRVAERSLTADSIEAAAAFVLAEQLGEAKDVGAATEVLLRAANCELSDAFPVALRRVQELTVDEAGLPSAGKGLHDIADLIRYGNVRQVDPAPLRPLLAQLYLRSCLLLFGACVCDDQAVPALRTGMDRIHDVAFLGEDGIDPALWLRAVRDVSESDTRNPFLSGYATALLIERGQLTDEEIDREVSRRLSPGTEASVGVGWFEGMVQRNRAALFLRQPLWAALATYVDGLDADGFKRALLYLRRSFSTFAPGEIRRVVGLLAQVWQTWEKPAADVAQVLAHEVEKTLDAEELQRATDDLGDLDLL
jgi:Family of unknown function (DUF5682)